MYFILFHADELRNGAFPISFQFPEDFRILRHDSQPAAVSRGAVIRFPSLSYLLYCCVAYLAHFFGARERVITAPDIM